MEIIKLKGELKEEIELKFLNELTDLKKAHDKICRRIDELRKKFDDHITKYFPVMENKPWEFNHDKRQFIVYDSKREMAKFHLADHLTQFIPEEDDE